MVVREREAESMLIKFSDFLALNLAKPPYVICQWVWFEFAVSKASLGCLVFDSWEIDDSAR
ncbi:MAG: hypothetical protein JL55_39655 [Pseudomonas sp. BICA1-14]|uniref:Uncharacterized protein n=1 Tax=Stutzerimonas stutzeri NF13 TaxID=1212548 RepID=M2V6B4_STUST|nr:hypothetical protein B381_04837 [Stutzerimonas stutzeri NF13]KMQ81941.1 MAG: hypothetical protein JL55_39655 [[Pseudomonas] sp. BICA1-14]HAG78892.1 hypothetical protein [Pseudomonas sp.]